MSLFRLLIRIETLENKKFFAIQSLPKHHESFWYGNCLFHRRLIAGDEYLIKGCKFW